ncbi:hypothetical protein SAMN05216316_1270 [Nitrosovibrio sp. Nv6]|nr:hypothetical protein SAMN05216316_1270 [Nitrosovibrio sp. Nv6]
MSAAGTFPIHSTALLSGNLAPRNAEKMYAGGGETWSGTELWEYYLLKRRDPAAARALKAAKTEQVEDWWKRSQDCQRRALK